MMKHRHKTGLQKQVRCGSDYTPCLSHVQMIKMTIFSRCKQWGYIRNDVKMRRLHDIWSLMLLYLYLFPPVS
jgi:hypothetical protein